MVRIYVQNKPLFLLEKVTPDIEDYIHRPETVFITELNSSNIDAMLRQLEQKDAKAGIFQHPDISTLLKEFKAHLTLIKAGGGLVYSADEALLIFRKGKWDLPKGKLDEGEDIAACAIREVKEETGIKSVNIVKPLQITYHTYHERGKHILKETHWYLMNTPEASVLTPQTEEDIEKCVWVPLTEVQNFTGNMHASIVDVVQEAERLLGKNA